MGDHCDCHYYYYYYYYLFQVKSMTALQHCDRLLRHFLLPFQWLVNFRKMVCEQFSIKIEQVELSMGMSNDFERAVSFYFILFFK